MGILYSTLNDWQTNYYNYLNGECDNIVKCDTVSSIMFDDLSKHPKIIELFGSITKTDINVPIENMGGFIDDLVDYIDTYIDLDKMGGKHSKLWSGYVHYEDKLTRLEAIKSKVVEILKIDESSEKYDKTLAVYLKKIITHITGDECGGFTLTDTRILTDSPTINYMHDHKQDNMNRYITNSIDSKGFVFCTEHDWQSCLTEKDTTTKFHQFDMTIHKDNKAKALYYSSNLVMREYMEDEIKAQMTEKGHTHYMSNYEKYADSFVVFNIYDPDGSENDIINQSMELTVIGIHAKSMGVKKDITNNLDEYRFLKSVIQAYKNFNLIVLGDFNVPEYSEGKEYFGLSEEDKLTYPIQNSYNDDIKDDSTYLVKGLTRFSTYELEDVCSKERTGCVGKNSQSIGGKCFKRNHNTDLVYGSIDDDIKSINTLYPTNTPKANLMIPLITGNINTDWLSDHQAIKTQLSNNHDSINISAYNVLSKCCSEGQPFKSYMTSEYIDNARDELCDILSELTNIILGGVPSKLE